MYILNILVGDADWETTSPDVVIATFGRCRLSEDDWETTSPDVVIAIFGRCRPGEDDWETTSPDVVIAIFGRCRPGEDDWETMSGHSIAWLKLGVTNAMTTSGDVVSQSSSLNHLRPVIFARAPSSWSNKIYFCFEFYRTVPFDRMANKLR